jgi:arylsulfatase A-like enzyme
MILRALCILFALQLAASAEAKRPNVLFIYADDQSYKTLSCYPGAFPGVKTPSIDALAQQGIRFRGAYLGSWCMPSRASLLTARQPHGIESMSMEGTYPGSKYDPQQCPFIPAQMRAQGYHTAQIGKWHTGTDAGWGRDWDHQIVWNRPLHPENAGAYYESQIVSWRGEEKKVDGYPADNYTQWACDYIRGKDRDAAKPFYLWLCYGSVHGPNTPAARHKGSYDSITLPQPVDMFPPRPGKPGYLEKTQAWTKDSTGVIRAGKNSGERVGDDDTSGKKGKRPGAEFQTWARRVNECVLAIDEGVAQLIETLKASGQYENTLIIYTADQGFAMGEHGFRSKVAPYDANYRSPLIVSMPSRFPTGKVCDASLNAPDLMVTLTSLMGVKVPWATHGRDASALLTDPSSAWPHATLYENMGQRYGRDVMGHLSGAPVKADHKDYPPYAAVVQGSWKLIQYLHKEHGEELYDLATDPEELMNLIASPEHSEKLVALRRALGEQLKQTEAPFHPIP